MLDQYLQHAFYFIAIFSAVPLALSSVLGLVVSFIQAATGVQEQTTVFLVKVSGMSLVLYLTGDAALSLMSQHLEEILSSIAILGKMS